MPYLNDRPPQSLLAADRETGGGELDNSGWQIVEIPLDEFGLRRPYIESLQLKGRFSGRLFIDDLGLIADPSTHIATDPPATPPTAELHPNYPNPFNGETAIRFTLPFSQEIDLAIYNLNGQQVTSLITGQRRAGPHSVRWNGRDDRGHPLASGLYFTRLRTGNQVTTRKLLLLR